ncbi:sphingosine kinase 1-like [Centruroides vittatus]|uniref:sphingosine kinase 1-like n=1 Tax=Centruroides vittatus TaxID=120091 RepID=UPI00350F8343
MDEESALLEDVFYLYPSRSIQCIVRLLEDKLTVRATAGHIKVVKYDSVSLKDVIGCHVMRGRTDGYYNHSDIRPDIGDPSAYIAIYTYPLTYRGTFLNKQQRRERYVLTFRILKSSRQQDNLAIAHHWRVAILWMLRQSSLPCAKELSRFPSVPPSTRRLLVFINPFGGTGKAYQIYRERVVALLAESDIEHDLIITARANHARDFVNTADLSHWSGIVVISGDGLLFEVFNGLMERDDWKKAIKIPVGIIPGGSGNGLAKAISHAVGEPYNTNNVISSTLNIVCGRVSPMDLVRVQTLEDNMYAFLSVGWGIMADIDIESEKLRAIGEARFTVWALVRALGLRKYRGRLSYLPVAGMEGYCKKNEQAKWKIERSKTMDDGFQWHKNYTKENGVCDAGLSRKKIERRSKSFIAIDSEEVTLPEADNVSQVEKHNYTSNNLEETYNPIFEVSKDENICNTKENDHMDENQSAISDQQSSTPSTSNADMYCSKLPSLSAPLPENWIVEEGEFVLVYVSLQTHLASDVFIAPNAKLDDGVMWLLIIRADVSRVQVINFLTCLQSGTHIDNPYVDMIPIYAFRLEPFSTDGFLTVDGEVIKSGPIQAEVLPSIARVMTL